MKTKILIAISDTNLANTIMSISTKHGYISEFVKNGNDVIHELLRAQPDLLIIDLNLPEKSGYDVLNEKSFDRNVTKIPVIIVSNSGDPIQMKKIPSTPTIRDYMIAPHIDAEDLMKKVAKVLNS